MGGWKEEEGGGEEESPNNIGFKPNSGSVRE